MIPIHTTRTRRLFAAVATLLALACSGGAAAQVPGRLPGLALRADALTISGLSSGAYMAEQFAVAYSASISGVAVVAGGPYGCSQGSVWTAALKCSCPVEHAFEQALETAWGFGCVVQSAGVYESFARTALQRNRDDIDPVANIARQRVWLYAAGKDHVVDPVLVEAARSFYASQGVAPARLHLEQRADAGHGFPSPFASEPCGMTASPYIVGCHGLDAARELLRWLYPDLPDSPGTVAAPALRPYSQARYGSGAYNGLDASGWVYVPEACEQPGAHCRLHVALHGCEQGLSFMTAPGRRYGRQFVDGAGYNRWAEAGGIVVLYPQVLASAGGTPFSSYRYNPKGCWDFWGYSSDTVDTAPLRFAQRSGPQMRAIKAMIDDLLRSGP